MVTSWVGSKEWANNELRYAIRVLQLKAFTSRRSADYLACALDIKSYLDEYGFWWQAKILGYHIHLFQSRHREALRLLREEACLQPC